jgi:hypothetical protein
VLAVKDAHRARHDSAPRDEPAEGAEAVRDGKETRMEMYADPAEALAAVGLAG